MVEMLIDEEVMEQFVEGLKHGFRHKFEECEDVARALEFKHAIPAKFWQEERISYGIMGLDVPLTKRQLRDMHTEMIDAICTALKAENLEVDNYARLFHALAILGLPKCSLDVPATRNNMKYNMAYYLWGLDDGTPEAWECIDNASWYAAESSKYDSWTPNLITGFRFSPEVASKLEK